MHVFTWTSQKHVSFYYRPQRSCGQGNSFTLVCHSVHGGVSSRENPPCQGEPPREQTPPCQGDPPGPGRPLPGTRPPNTCPPPPPEPGRPPPPRKQTSAYSEPAVGTHPTGMHSCMTIFSEINRLKISCC